jgi:hypothetical protein
MTGRSFLRTLASLAAHPRPPPFADGPDGVQDSYPRVYPPDSALWRDDCEEPSANSCGRYRTRHERADRARWRVCKFEDPRSLERLRIIGRRLGLEPIRRRLTDTLDMASSFGKRRRHREVGAGCRTETVSMIGVSPSQRPIELPHVVGQRSSSGAFSWAVEKAVLDRGAIALCSSSKHWVIFEVWRLMS